MRRSVPAAVLVLVAIAACSPETSSTTTSQPATTTTSITATSTTIPATTSTTLAADATVTVLLARFSELGPRWSELVFPYGEGEEFLRTSPGGEGLLWGPEYGTQTPDGTWWFLDAANLRVAHFSGDGTYLDQVVLPEDLLVDGQYFQYQMPQALYDGSVVAAGFRDESTMALLRIVAGEASGATFEGEVPWVTTDGVSLFGLGFDGAAYRLDPNEPVTEPVDWLLGRDGSRYLASVDGDEVRIELPDAGVTRTLQMRFSEDPEVSVMGGIEVEATPDGWLHVLFYGAPASDETLGVGGLLTIGADGTLGEVEPIIEPSSTSDPGSPARLGVGPEHSDPWLMVVGVDGVHVFTRQA